MYRFIVLYVCIYVAPWSCEARHFVPLYVPTCSGMTIKLNLNLNLKDDDFIKYFKEEWALYLDYNDLPGTSASVIWEAGKAVMRGRIISFSSHKKKREINVFRN